MENRKVVEHGIYRHFKGKYYIVEGIANNSETSEPMVVYRHLYGDRSLCARPVDMFLSEVDHEKYPDVKQKYRFEEVDEYGGKPVGDKSVGPFPCLCEMFGIDRHAADAQDALMSAIWANTPHFSGSKPDIGKGNT